MERLQSPCSHAHPFHGVHRPRNDTLHLLPCPAQPANTPSPRHSPPLQAVVTWRWSAATPRRAPRHLGRRRMPARSLAHCHTVPACQAASSQVTPNTDGHRATWSRRATTTPRAPRHVAMHAATSPIDGPPHRRRPDACAASIIHFPRASINTSPHARPWPSTHPSHLVLHTVHSSSSL
jgi:hypothetical protein